MVLNFDEVIADSTRESFAVALQAHLDLKGRSSLENRGRNEFYRAFVASMPLGKREEGYALSTAGRRKRSSG